MDVVHKSAHPSLPPAAPQQVVQYLLAKNFHLTALELLVEAQQSGHGDDVRDLEAFFMDRDRFPPEELARYQQDNAFDLQAAGRERESRLQLAEYELRLAKEDLAEMARKLAQAQAQERQQLQQAPSTTANGAPQAAALPPAVGSSTGGPSPFSPDVAPPSPGPDPCSAAQCSAPGAAPTPAEQRALNAAVFAHLLRQGLVTTAMTMEEEYGGPLRPLGSTHASAGPAATHGSAEAAGEIQPWELWSWYRAAATRGPSGDGGAGGAAAAPVSTVGTGGGGASPLHPCGAASTAVDPEELVRQYGLIGPDPNEEQEGHISTVAGEAAAAASAAAEPKTNANGNGGEGTQPPEEDEAGLRAELRAAREELAATRARARAAVAAAVAAATAATAQQLQQQLRSLPMSLPSPAQPPLSFISADANVLDLLDLGSSAPLAPPAAEAAPASAAGPAPHTQSLAPPAGGRSAATPSPSDGAEESLASTAAASGAAAEGPTRGSGSRAGDGDDDQPQPPWRRIDPSYHASLEVLLSGLCDMLPRLVPNLNVKSRLEVLPLLVSAAKATPDWSVRRQLLAAVFNLTPAPDYQQRQAIIDASLELCQAFGSGWAANELVQLCCKQASSPTCERRTLVAEALGEAVGAVDPGTQAHVLLTQLSQLAKDRMDRVREAAVHSLARLVPRLPFTRSYYSTLEGLLLPLATDASEAVHVAALSYLVPALLTWQPQDTETVLVSSCMARVLSEMGQQVRIIEQYQQHFFNQLHHQQQAQQQKAAATAPPAAAESGSNGGSFAGTFLRYSGHQAPPASPAPAAPPPAHRPSSEEPSSSAAAAGAASTRGSSSSLSDAGAAAAAGAGTQPSAAPLPAPPPSPPPPPQWVTFGRRSFPSASHLMLYQLLALYGGLTPALRHAALRSRPAWACPAGSESGASDKAGAKPLTTPAAPAAGHGSAPAATGKRHHRAGSQGEPSSFAGAAAAAASVRDPTDLLSSATHRRTSSHPVFGGLVPFGGSAAGGVMSGSGGSQPSLLSARVSLPPQQAAALHQLLMPKSSSSGALVIGDGNNAHGMVAGAGGGSGLAARTSGSGSGRAPGEPVGNGGSAGAAGEEERGGSPARQQEVEEAEDGVVDEAGEDWERAAEDASLAAWATNSQHGSWKTLEWVVQHVVPELIRLICCVGPMFPEALDVRRQAAGAVAATCSALGAAFTQAVMEPLFLMASGAGATLAAPGVGVAVGAAGSATGGGGPGVVVAAAEVEVPLAVRDACAAVQPRSAEALRMARQCVLPVLLVSVLPAAQRLRPYLLHLMGSAHELRQRWLMEALPDYTAALTFACSQRPDLLPQVLHVFEDLLSGAGSKDQTPSQGPQSHAGGGEAAGVADAAVAVPPQPAAAAGPASTHVGLCCTALARALVPIASLELASRRLLPGLMALMSYGEPDLQRACVGVLAELGLRFRGDGPRVSEQVLAVYDSLLEQGGHAVQLEVLAAGTALAAAAAPSAAVAAAAAAQVEWLLTAVQVVAARLTAPSAGGGAPAVAGGMVGGGPTLEQQRALAAQLLAALRAVAPYDLRLPRLQANLSAALDAMQRCKALLPDPQQQQALAALVKERPTGQSAAGASVSSAPSAGAAAAGAPVPSLSAAPLRMGGAPPLPPLPAYPSPSPGPAVTPTQSAAGGAGLMHPFMPHPAGTPPVTHGSAGQGAHATTPDGGQAGASGQLRSRFDAFRQRLMKRREDAPAANPPGAAAVAAAAAAGARPKESFFSDDEGEL